MIKLNPIDKKSHEKRIGRLSKIPKDVDNILKKEADKAVKAIKADAPVNTGRLKRSVETTNTKGGVEVTSEAIDPKTGKDYAVFQEYGGRYTPAKPYFKPNIRKMQRNVTAGIKKKLK